MAIEQHTVYKVPRNLFMILDEQVDRSGLSLRAEGQGRGKQAVVDIAFKRKLIAQAYFDPEADKYVIESFRDLSPSELMRFTELVKRLGLKSIAA